MKSATTGIKNGTDVIKQELELKNLEGLKQLNKSNQNTLDIY